MGTAMLTMCGPNGPPQARDVYAEKEDCVHDWGDEKKCEPVQQAGYGRTGYHYYGPYYTYTGPYNDGLHPPVRSGSHAIGTTVARGGFGSSAAAHGARGS